MNDHPELGSMFKGAHVKQIMSYLTEKAIEFNTGTDRDNVRECMMWGQAECDAIMDAAGLMLSEEEANSAFIAGMTFLQCYQWLGNNDDGNKMQSYKPRPKMHPYLILSI